jgi:hypothetical protein
MDIFIVKSVLELHNHQNEQNALLFDHYRV